MLNVNNDSLIVMCVVLEGFLTDYMAKGSRLTIVSREAKKKQRTLSELFTWTTTKKLGNAQAKPP